MGSQDMDAVIAEAFTSSLWPRAVPWVLLDVRDHACIEHALPIPGRLKAAIAIAIGTSQGHPDLFGHLLQPHSIGFSGEEGLAHTDSLPKEDLQVQASGLDHGS